MAPLLIVSRSRPELLSRLREAFADFPGIEIILDRREATSGSLSERRQWDIEAALRAYGWALVGEAAPLADDAGEHAARRILVADDHEDTRHLLEWVLRRAGHDVIQADDGNIAIVKAHAWRPDLVIVDMFMPEKDGTEVIRELRRWSRPPKVVAISAGWRAGGVRVLNAPHDMDVLDDATAAGADAVMAKPIDPRTLLGVVERLLVS